MRRSFAWVAVALMMASGTAFCTACSSSSQTGDEPTPNINMENNKLTNILLTRSEQQFVDGSNDFAFRLLKSAATDDRSMILSPISITYALGMLNNGATDETRKEIEQVLGFGDTDTDSINAFCRKMLAAAPKLDKLTKVMIANTIYMNKDYQLMPEFVKKAKTYYDAEPETRDFHDGKTMGVINQWASDHTEKMITEVLNRDSFNPDAVSYLLNAIYFKGTWTDKFDKDLTTDEPFTTPAGTTATVPMMHQQGDFAYTETEDLQALSLPYGNRAYEMTILLPKEGKTLAQVMQQLNSEQWQQLKASMSPVDAIVKLPRFESNTNLSLNDIMSSLGMPRAFSPDEAQFPDFCNVPTYISMMKQVARIKLNEEGTEAAAVTVIGMELTCVGPDKSQPIEFFADHPFLYVISEQSTGALFFIGSYCGD